MGYLFLVGYVFTLLYYYEHYYEESNNDLLVLCVVCVLFQSSGEGLRNVINWVKKMYDRPPTLITENGCRSTLGLNDTDRITLYHVSDQSKLFRKPRDSLIPVVVLIHILQVSQLLIWISI